VRYMSWGGMYKIVYTMCVIWMASIEGLNMGIFCE
jgi:hypothetical protein